MDSFEINKILGALLGSLLIITLVRLGADMIYQTGSTEGLPTPDVVAVAPDSKNLEEEIPLKDLLKQANLKRGTRLSKKCVSCHTFDKGGANRIGPNLWDIVNKKMGAVAGFSYSAALKKKGGQWGYDSLDQFLKSPRKYISGTIMSFAGLRKAQDRAHMILYLRSLSDKPPALP